MKIENFRTDLFKSKVNQVIKERGHNEMLHKKLQYNIDLKGNTKDEITFSGKKIPNVVAYYWTKEVDSNKCPLHCITNEEVELVNELEIEPVVKKRKVQSEYDVFEVGEIGHVSNFGDDPVRILSIKGKTIVVEKVYMMFKLNDKVGLNMVRLPDGEAKEDRYYYASEVILGYNSQDYAFDRRDVENENIRFINVPGKEITFRLNIRGLWKSPGTYGNYLNKRFSLTHMSD